MVAKYQAEDLILRRYATEDWPHVCRIHDAARPRELAAGGVDRRAFRPMTDVAAADEFFDSETVLACIDDAAAGFVSWNGSYLSWLYVDPQFQHRGVGGRLLAHALQQIGAEAWTNMLAGNEAALKLYRRAGMDIVHTRPSDCDGYPCQAMRLALPTSRMHDPTAKRQQ